MLSICNAYLPQRTILQNGIGNVKIKVHKVMGGLSQRQRNMLLTACCYCLI
ncbi:MAG: hypothetical protein ACTS73_05160 [Arsenophonus sp. NEOnobi-MAG3]